jgi:hypothetical protein
VSDDPRERFLSALKAGLRGGPLARRRVLAEIAAHLDDTVAELRAHGLAKDAAINEALRPSCTFTTPIHIPRGMWFMMGGNRGVSDDSRFWGPIPTKWIIGDAFFTYWPPNRVGFFYTSARLSIQKRPICRHDAAKESNLPSRGLPGPASFEDWMGHQARAAPALMLRGAPGCGLEP